MFNYIEKNKIIGLKTSNTYSTDEVVIGSYLGKPLYRKVVTSAGWTRSSYNFTITDFPPVETMVNLSAATSSSIVNGWSSGTSGLSYNTGIKWNGGTSKVIRVINTSSGNFTGTCYSITMEYTKTTD